MTSRRKPSGEIVYTEALPRAFRKARAVATSIGMHPRTLYRWADAGLIRRYKINERVVLFDQAEVEEFIQAGHTSGPTANDGA